MKFKVSEIHAGQAALQKLISANIPIATAYALMELADAAIKVLSKLEDHRKKVSDKYGLTNKKKPSAKERKKADVEMQVFLDEKVDIAFVPLTLDSLKGADISPIELKTIKWIIADKA